MFGLKGNPALNGTALDDAVFGTLLLPRAGAPRSVDLWPIFHTGVPNVIPYHLATGKGGNPLAAGKPFIHNFLPNGGDMLRLNMAVPVTQRNDPAFSSLGIIAAAVAGLTDPKYANKNLEFIPNMDGFPNGRRLEDDVTRIELQAVAGVALAAIGLWYDDYNPLDPNASPVTPNLIKVLSYTTQIEKNDTTFTSSFPYVQAPWSGTGICSGEERNYTQPEILKPSWTTGITDLNGPQAFMFNTPNPFTTSTTFKYHVRESGNVSIHLYHQDGTLVRQLMNTNQGSGNFEFNAQVADLIPGTYYATISFKGQILQTIKLNKI